MGAVVADGESRLYSESWKAVYFEPLIAAIKEIAKDDMGNQALKAALKGVTIQNTLGCVYPDNWAKFEGGTLTLDHDPITNANDGGPRAGRLVEVLEEGL